MTLNAILNDYLGAPKRRPSDPHRAAREAFKRKAARWGFTYRVTRDGYLEVAPFLGFPKGINMPHYDWSESYDRLLDVLEDPGVLDCDGYYTI